MNETSEPVRDDDSWSGAHWIWHPRVEKMHNFHMLARKPFSLPAGIQCGTCLVSANTAYELYINGEWVGRGPVRSTPEWQYYDETDVGAHLRAGDNVVAVHVYHHGEQDTGALGQVKGPGALLVKMTVDCGSGTCELGTDASWRVLRAPQYEIDVGHVTWHRHDFKEVCHADREVLGWRQAGYDDSAWEPAQVLGPVPTAPWSRLVCRDIPFFTRESVWPVNAFGHLSACAYGFSEYDITNPRAILRDDAEVAEILPLNHDFEVQLILDFGKPVVGRFHLDIVDSAGGEVSISYGESLDLTRVDRLITRPGAQHYQPYERRFGRYVLLTCRNLHGPLKLRGAWFELVAYPVKDAGEFACNDRLMNRIWDVGCWTLRLNMHDHFEDCPWREQTLYCGDLAVSALLAYYAFGDYALARHSIAALARIQTDEGIIPSCGPVLAPGDPVRRFIPEYPALWLMALEAYWHHSGDMSIVEELWPNVKRLLAWYLSWHDERGLMRQLPREMRADFVDNLAGVNMDGQVLAVQALYHRALKAAGALARALGDGEVAEQVAERAQQLAAALNEYFWDEELHGYLDCLEDCGDAGNRTTPDVEPGTDSAFRLNQISNGLMLFCGLVPPERLSRTLGVLLDTGKAPPVRAGYMNFYLTEALFATGHPDEAVRRLRDYWGAMIERGATTFWEVFDPDTPAGEYPDRLWSLCHEFCCGPVYTLPAHILGVQPLEPGFSRVRIMPEPCDLRWARGRIPTPAGVLEVSWQRVDDGLRFECETAWPAGVAVELLLPAYRRAAPRVRVDGELVSCGRLDGKVVLRFESEAAAQRHRVDVS